MRHWKTAIAVCWLMCGAATGLFGQRKDLGAIVPSAYPMCVTVPNVKQAYERYQATGVGRLFSSAPMAPFVGELKKSGAMSLCNWQGFLGFDDKLLSEFPKPGVFMAVPPKPVAAVAPVAPPKAAPGQPAVKPAPVAAPPKPKGNIVFLIETAKDDKAIDACLKSAEAYLSGQRAKKSTATIPGATMAVVFDTPTSASHPATQHVYFYTESGFFGVSSSLAAVKEYLALKVVAKDTLSANAEFASGRKQLKAESDLYIYTRPLETLDLWEEKPRKGRTNVAKFTNQGFKDLTAITAVIQFTGAAHDVDYQAIFFTKKPPYQKGMRVLQLSPGPEVKVPAWVPLGLAELSQFNHNQDMLYLARANWYDELEVDGNDGFFLDMMEDVKREKGGVMVDFRKDIFGKLKEAQLQAIDVRGKVTEHNLLGRMSLKIAEIADAKAVTDVTDALTRFYDLDVKRGEVNFEDKGGVKIWWVAPPKSLLISAKSTGGQQVNTMAIIDKYYIMSNDTDLVRAMVKSAGDFANDKVLANLAAENRKLQSAATGARSAVRWEELWAAPFEAVRSADAKYDKEREVKLLRAILTGDNTLKYAGLYKLLPPFATAKPFLSPAGCTVDVVPDGLALKGFILKP